MWLHNFDNVSLQFFKSKDRKSILDLIMEAKIMLSNKKRAKDSETLIPMAMAIDDGDIDVENQQLYSRQM